jgi:arsenite transporter
VALGALFPQVCSRCDCGAIEVARINLVIAVLIWLMIVPDDAGGGLCSAVASRGEGGLRHQPSRLLVTVAMNWLVKPFTMTAMLAWLVHPGSLQRLDPGRSWGMSYIAGMILLGVAPCTAMVFVWSRLCRGNPNYTLVQVAVNNLIMVVAFAPIAALLLGVSQVVVPWDTLQLSVGLFVVIPLAAGWLTRRFLASERAIDHLERLLKPWTIVGLLGTVVLLFGFQAGRIAENPALIVLVAIPLILQTVLIFLLTALGMRACHQQHDVAAPGALIGASNFFELAVAVAISLFGVTLRRRPGHGGGGAGGGAGDAGAGGGRQPQQTAVSLMGKRAWLPLATKPPGLTNS